MLASTTGILVYFVGFVIAFIILSTMDDYSFKQITIGQLIGRCVMSFMSWSIITFLILYFIADKFESSEWFDKTIFK